MCVNKMNIDVTPIDKRPVGLWLIIISLALAVPMNLYELIFGEDEYPFLTVAITLLSSALAIGLWHKIELARRALISVAGILIFINLFSLALAFSALQKGTLPASELVPGLGGLVLLAIIVLYLRSGNLLRYYWADDIRKSNT